MEGTRVSVVILFASILIFYKVTNPHNVEDEYEEIPSSS